MEAGYKLGCSGVRSFKSMDLLKVIPCAEGILKNGVGGFCLHYDWEKPLTFSGGVWGVGQLQLQ